MNAQTHTQAHPASQQALLMVYTLHTSITIKLSRVIHIYHSIVLQFDLYAVVILCFCCVSLSLAVCMNLCAYMVFSSVLFMFSVCHPVVKFFCVILYPHFLFQWSTMYIFSVSLYFSFEDPLLFIEVHQCLVGLRPPFCAVADYH